ncbi:MAG TPA: hypothetical protein VGE26_11310 [Sphingobacteriaceae bacterium]
MKALTTIALTATLILILAINTFANDSTGKPAVKETATIALPEFVWGTPEDICTGAVEGLKYADVQAPQFVWGSPEDINAKDLQMLKASATVTLPEFVWGTPEDAQNATVEALKHADQAISFPEFVWGDPQDVNVKF